MWLLKRAGPVGKAARGEMPDENGNASPLPSSLVPVAMPSMLNALVC